MTIQAVQATLVTLPSSGSPGAADGSASDPPPLLPGSRDLLASGDAGSMIAALCVEMGRTQKKQALENRRSAEALESSEQNAQIEALRDKADLTRVQGIVNGAVTIGSAGLELGSTLSSISASKHGDAAGHLDPNGKADYTSSEKALLTNARDIEVGVQRQRQTESAAYGAGSKLDSGLGQIADGLFKGAIADKEADATVHEQLATRAKRAVDDAMGEVDDAKKLIEKALDFYKEYTGAKNGAVSAAIHRA